MAREAKAGAKYIGFSAVIDFKAKTADVICVTSTSLPKVRCVLAEEIALWADEVSSRVFSLSPGETLTLAEGDTDWVVGVFRTRKEIRGWLTETYFAKPEEWEVIWR